MLSERDYRLWLPFPEQKRSSSRGSPSDSPMSNTRCSREISWSLTDIDEGEGGKIVVEESGLHVSVPCSTSGFNYLVRGTFCPLASPCQAYLRRRRAARLAVSRQGANYILIITRDSSSHKSAELRKSRGDEKKKMRTRIRASVH